MTFRTFFKNAALAMVGMGFVIAAPVYAHDPLDDKPHEWRGKGDTPLCSEPKVINRVVKRFNKNNKKHRDTTVTMAVLDDVRETSFKENYDDLNDRRFCVGHAKLSNGRTPHVYYLVQERQGIASIGWNVEFCVSGLDFERAHGAHCRSLRAPF